METHGDPKILRSAFSLPATCLAAYDALLGRQASVDDFRLLCEGILDLHAALGQHLAVNAWRCLERCVGWLRTGLLLRSLSHLGPLRVSSLVRCLGRSITIGTITMSCRRSSGFEAFSTYWESSVSTLLLFVPAAVGAVREFSQPMRFKTNQGGQGFIARGI